MLSLVDVSVAEVKKQTYFVKMSFKDIYHKLNIQTQIDKVE